MSRRLREFLGALGRYTCTPLPRVRHGRSIDHQKQPARTGGTGPGQLFLCVELCAVVLLSILLEVLLVCGQPVHSVQSCNDSKIFEDVNTNSFLLPKMTE